MFLRLREQKDERFHIVYNDITLAEGVKQQDLIDELQNVE